MNLIRSTTAHNGGSFNTRTSFVQKDITVRLVSFPNFSSLPGGIGSSEDLADLTCVILMGGSISGTHLLFVMASRLP